MRTRLSQQDRCADILNHARDLFRAKGFGATEMEDIRLACGMSRGGLYHHFNGKHAILAALIDAEIREMAGTLKGMAGDPVAVLVGRASVHLGNEGGVLTSLATEEDRLTYLSYLDLAMTRHLRPVLVQRLNTAVAPGVDPVHAADLFLSINGLINRRAILGEWTDSEAAGFAATALNVFASLLADTAELAVLVEKLREVGRKS